MRQPSPEFDVMGRHRLRLDAGRSGIVLPWLMGAALALGSCATTSRGLETAAIEVFLVAGQSNAVGFDAPADELDPTDIDGRSILWWRVGDPPPDDFDSTSGSRGWQTLQAQPRGEPMEKGSLPRQYGNFRDGSGGFGPEVGFARELARGDDGAGDAPRRAFIKVAFSGTSLAGDWDPARRHEADSCYVALMNEATGALAALRAAGRRPKLSALLWVQGESDATVEKAPLYAEHLLGFIEALRRDLDAPGLAAVLAVNDQFGGGNRPRVAEIVEAQRSVAAQDPFIEFTDASDLTRANGAHFDAEGTLALGARMARAYLVRR